MKSIIRFKIAALSLVLTVAFAWFGLLPQMQAAPDVVPAPDGCYPNFTTAEGCNALNALSTGAGNTGVGWYSLFLDTTGSYNTGVGGGALALNNADSNTAVGAAALLLNTSGTLNTAVGTDALVYNDSGSNNNAFGAFALFSNTNNNANTATGYQALFQNNGGANTANGWTALHDNTTGSSNTAIGERALPNNTTGNNNTALGSVAGNNVTTANNVICIGAGVFGSNTDNTCYIGNIFNQSSPSGTAVFVNSDGKLGTTVSSQQFKDDIKAMDKTSEAILALKPVTFRYKKEFDPTGLAQFGLVAEDVEKVNPDLVVRDNQGKPYSVRYDQVNAMLLNEFLKEHRKVEELTKNFESKLLEQDKQIKALTSTLEKVSARIELSRTTTELADGH